MHRSVYLEISVNFTYCKKIQCYHSVNHFEWNDETIYVLTIVKGLAAQLAPLGVFNRDIGFKSPSPIITIQLLKKKEGSFEVGRIKKNIYSPRIVNAKYRQTLKLLKRRF